MSTASQESTSSIGAVWPPVESSNNRLKGFYDQVVETDTEVQKFTDEFSHYTQEAIDHPKIDRVSIRLVASLGAIPTLSSLGVPLEAGMPIRNNTDHFIVYTYWNSTNRMVSEDKMSAHRQLIQTANTKDRRTTDAIEELKVRGFVPEVIDHTTPTDNKVGLVDRFTSLYNAFGYNKDEVESLLLDPANTIAFIEDEKGVISTAMAERVGVKVGGIGQIAMAEITEAFTLPTHRNKKLYELVSGYLTERLIDNKSTPLDVIYGESNLAMPGVVIAGHRNGRRFSHLDRDLLGINQPNFGILQQSFHIEDGEETRPYNDFAVSYVTFDK